MSDTPFPRRLLGTSDIEVSPVGFGCWPIAGMTTIGTNCADSLATLRVAFQSGINFFDTAFAYGAKGESDRLIASFLREYDLHQSRRKEIVIASKGGIHWDEAGNRVQDARPSTLRSELESSLQRLGLEFVDIFYLHAPDPKVSISDSAGGCQEIRDAGLARYVGASNLCIEQLRSFSAECPIVACQPPYNMIQRDIESEILPWCKSHDVGVVTYWTLMKGLLAGKLPRDHVFEAGDSRANYDVFQGDEWERNQDVVDVIREIGKELDRSVAEIVVNWTIQQPGITTALVGGKRPYQVEETARAMQWRLPAAYRDRIEDALTARRQVRPSDS